VLALQSLMQHYHHSVASEAKKLEQPLPKLESDLTAQLDTDVDDVGLATDSDILIGSDIGELSCYSFDCSIAYIFFHPLPAVRL